MSATLQFKNNVRRIVIDGDLNMSNTNARAFLAALGLNTDFENFESPLEIPIDEFESSLRRYVESQIGDYVDQGTPTMFDVGQSGATLVYCGRSPGYIGYRVDIALQMAIEAKSKGATTVYFV